MTDVVIRPAEPGDLPALLQQVAVPLERGAPQRAGGARPGGDYFCFRLGDPSGVLCCEKIALPPFLGMPLTCSMIS